MWTAGQPEATLVPPTWSKGSGRVGGDRLRPQTTTTGALTAGILPIARSTTSVMLENSSFQHEYINTSEKNFVYSEHYFTRMHVLYEMFLGISGVNP